MAGIYIHIPYCKTRCIYCDFYKEVDESSMDSFVKALCAELVLRKGETNEKIKTIYFGGGTPTRLSDKHFKDIFSVILSNYDVENDAEITIEANPDDLLPQYVDMIYTLPVNRLSIGIQSFADKELKFLSRRHSAKQAIDAVKYCQQAEFDNISIDLIYGLPNQTLEVWNDNLQNAIDLNIQHISAYHLIYEEDTKLYNLLERGKVSPVADTLSTAMFSSLIDKLDKNGFVQYEISNFAKDGLLSKHNTSYWLDEVYLGFGPSAHSYNRTNRIWNVSSIGKYLRAIEQGKLLQDGEKLTSFQMYNEYIITRLRVMQGISLSILKKRFGEELMNFCVATSQKYIDKGLLILEGGNLRLSRDGIFISDGIMSDLLWVE